MMMTHILGSGKLPLPVKSAEPKPAKPDPPKPIHESELLCQECERLASEAVVSYNKIAEVKEIETNAKTKYDLQTPAPK